MSWLFGSTGEEEKKNSDGTDDITAQASNLLGSFMTLAASVGEAVKENAEKVADVALSDFQKEQKKFVQSKKTTAAGSSLPPWVGYDDEDELKSKILALSQDERNFIRDPPAGQSGFKFDMDKQVATATSVLQEDKNLQKMRTKLVPKQLTEEKFWTNYFYRVSLVQSSFDVSAMASEEVGDAASADPNVEPQGLNAPPPTIENKTAAEDIDENKLNEVNDSLQMNDMEEQEELEQHLPASQMENVSLEELGGGIADTPSRETPEEESTAATNNTDTNDDDVGETNGTGSGDATPAATDTDTSEKWEKDLDAELEGFSEFEAMQGEGDQEELDDGWEDEVAQMLEAEGE